MILSLVLAAALTPVTSFGTNPGALKMYKYVPAGVPLNAPLVVVMHGCNQTAEQYRGTGWEALADSEKFYLVYAEQSSANNPVSCFNWAGEYGDPANLERGKGENQSIKEMVDKMKADHSIDSTKVYVAGFSAGGAFAAVMLATWPELFAGGAVMSGVPYRCASTVQGAYDCMALNAHAERKKTADEWGDLVRAAHPTYAGVRPPVLLLHGANDYTVHSDNMIELVEQWTDVHGIDQTADESDAIGNHAREKHKKGAIVVVESIRVAGMAHASAIDPNGTPACGTLGSFVEDRDLCAAWQAARFFGIVQGDDGGGGTVDAIAPTVSLLNPTDAAEVSGWVDVSAQATDDVEMDRVEFWVDGQLKASSGEAPYEWRWQTAVYEPGDHVVEARAIDTTGNEASDEATVKVSGSAAATPRAVDPIPWTCAATTRGGGAAWLALGAALVAAFRRKQ
jgi:poly(hydroxyalkanoate) depolymerase family esterase